MKIIKIRIKGEWKCHLISCPSQCQLEFKWDNRFFVIYLRWRWDDPWQACLIECENEVFDIEKTKFNWIPLDIPFFKENQLKEVKLSAIEEAERIIK